MATLEDDTLCVTLLVFTHIHAWAVGIIFPDITIVAAESQLSGSLPAMFRDSPTVGSHVTQ